MNILSSLKQISSPERALTSQRFFKTGKGDYGEGDVFLGATVPRCRKIAKEFSGIDLQDVKKHLSSKYHEERLIALLVLVEKFNHADENIKKEIYEFYLENKKYVNNWDLVDLSADKIVGQYLLGKNKSRLHNLAKSESLWDRRIAIVSTYAFIKKGNFDETLKISEILLKDDRDLIQKASGWMLREVGKRDAIILKQFLARYYKEMPRTMLRYAIERFPEEMRKSYLKGEFV
jgi:3-methyladenine DNA glycosylase AlkD